MKSWHDNLFVLGAAVFSIVVAVGVACVLYLFARVGPRSDKAAPEPPAASVKIAPPAPVEATLRLRLELTVPEVQVPIKVVAQGLQNAIAVPLSVKVKAIDGTKIPVSLHIVKVTVPEDVQTQISKDAYGEKLPAPVVPQPEERMK